MADSTFFKGLVLWLGVFAVLAVVAGGTFAFAFLGIGQAPPAMDDLHVSNYDGASHSVRVEVAAANDSAIGFDRTVRLASGDRVGFDGTTEYGRQYRLLVAVDDGVRQTFDIEGPDDSCTVEVRVEESATVEVGQSCA